jgi:hypothetical protein
MANGGQAALEPGDRVQEEGGGHFFLDTKFVNVLTFKSLNPIFGESNRTDAFNYLFN